MHPPIAATATAPGMDVLLYTRTLFCLIARLHRYWNFGTRPRFNQPPPPLPLLKDTTRRHHHPYNPPYHYRVHKAAAAAVHPR